MRHFIPVILGVLLSTALIVLASKSRWRYVNQDDPLYLAAIPAIVYNENLISENEFLFVVKAINSVGRMVTSQKITI